MDKLNIMTNGYNSFYATVTNSLSNNQHYKDAKTVKEKREIIDTTISKLIETLTDNEIKKLGTEKDIKLYFDVLVDISHEGSDKMTSEAIDRRLKHYCSEHGIKNKKEFSDGFIKVTNTMTDIFQEKIKKPSVSRMISNI
jgi:hypothetical protein